LCAAFYLSQKRIQRYKFLFCRLLHNKAYWGRLILLAGHKQKNMERRNFLKAAGTFCAIAPFAGIVESCKKQTASGPSASFTIDLTDPGYAALKTVGGSVVKSGVIVICTGTDTYSALSDSCTHQGCLLNYDKPTNHLVCPCHGGSFDLTGKVLGGPPPSNLKTYTASLSGTTITVSG
jgi:cytochrome b6-f complex iron-sulfur subunit